MGRKRWWQGVNCLSIVLILLLEGSGAHGAGEVGCLFDKTLCKTLDETCYDDAAFGRCIQPYTPLDSPTAYRYDLDPLELELLRSVLERLVTENYQWSHPYTQCVITTTLTSIRYKTPSSDFTCDDLEDLPAPLSPSGITTDPDDDGISPLAVVNFVPTRGHGYGDFANELYYPPPLPLTEEISKVNGDDDMMDASLQRLRLNRHPTLRFAEEPQEVTEDSDEPDETDRYDEELYELSKRLQEQAEALRAAQETKMLRSRRHSQRETLAFIGDPYEDGYADTYRRSNVFRPKEVNTTLFQVNGDLEDFMKYFEATGGLSGAGRKEPDDDDEDDSTEIDLGDYNEIPYWEIAADLPGFKRPERLDVKKPGPYFSTNNYAFKMPTSAPDQEDGGVQGVRKNFVKKELVFGKDISFLSPSQNFENVDVDHVDVDRVFIKFNKEIRHWIDGEIITKTVAKLLGLQMDDLTETRVGRAEVTFTVMPNRLRMNATQIVKSLSNIRGDLEKIANMKMTVAGIGDKKQIPLVVFPQVEVAEPDSQNVIQIIACVVIGAVAAASMVLMIIVHRQSKTRRKLAGLATPDPEASKDYQELCRARMQAKVPTVPSEKPESPRIISLSKESESNRSSTSSWGGDDPAALTNMDIATGHMVLMYMEDHLKNKDRLDQEWAAICAYETDPSSIAIATDKENIDKNRPGSAFPYDHSRIVLNDLSNVNNSDYINASTITDHDPRNPAYIATQGPLPQTSSDFWQLVWEQGSVVIVMLTRLTEEGHAMCHRYWPEEGSELYHIYEVHLVSEHIWCDDYLVRSFYLKNLRTGETRTVTQFHFLSWPENGVPQSTKALLEFRRKVNKSYRGRSCPIVVHCSDGAGRTGTYCLIDMVLNRMAKGAKEIDIAAALEHIRDQRPGMVSTKQQFEFVLVAVAEEVHAILKALPVQPPEKSQNTSTPSSSGSDK